MTSNFRNTVVDYFQSHRSAKYINVNIGGNFMVYAIIWYAIFYLFIYRNILNYLWKHNIILNYLYEHTGRFYIANIILVTMTFMISVSAFIFYVILTIWYRRYIMDHNLWAILKDWAWGRWYTCIYL